MLGLIIGASLEGSLSWRIPLAMLVAASGIYPSIRIITGNHGRVTLLALTALFYGICFLVGTFQERQQIFVKHVHEGADDTPG